MPRRVPFNKNRNRRYEPFDHQAALDALKAPITVDYKRLLKVYMATVAGCEGISFADEIGRDELTKQEWEALYEIECEVDRDKPMLRKPSRAKLGCPRCVGWGTIRRDNGDREMCDLCHGNGFDPGGTP